MSAFADTSALVKLYADEAGHETVRRCDAIVIAQISRVEVTSALWKKHRMGELDAAVTRTLCSEFDADYHGDSQAPSRFIIVPATEKILENASQLVAIHALRAYDAVQLATALAVSQLDYEELVFLCFDKQLSTIAATVGLSTPSA